VYRLQFTRQAVKALRKMPANEAQLLRLKLDDLAREPFSAPNVKKLSGRPGYRMRMGDWRVIFEIHENARAVDVIKIAPRGGAYR